MQTILIVDDEAPARKRLSELLRRFAPAATLLEAQNGRQAMEMLRSTRVDLVFLDVQMPLMTGLDVVQEFGTGNMPLTIFVTAYDRHAINAFELNAIDYLLKPYSDSRFEAALHRGIARAEEKRSGAFAQEFLQAFAQQTNRKRYLDRLAVKTDSGTRLVPVAQIESMESAGVYVTLHSHGKEYLYRGTLTRLAEELNPEQFVRIHRSTIVNVAAIVLLEATSHGEFEAELKSGRHVQVSRTFRNALEKRLQQTL